MTCMKVRLRGMARAAPGILGGIQIRFLEAMS
jgi:hypothetical protein